MSLIGVWKSFVRTLSGLSMTGPPFFVGFFFKFLRARGAGDADARVDAVLLGLEGVAMALPLRVNTRPPLRPWGGVCDGSDVIIA